MPCHRCRPHGRPHTWLCSNLVGVVESREGVFGGVGWGWREALHIKWSQPVPLTQHTESNSTHTDEYSITILTPPSQPPPPPTWSVQLPHPDSIRLWQLGHEQSGGALRCGGGGVIGRGCASGVGQGGGLGKATLLVVNSDPVAATAQAHSPL